MNFFNLILIAKMCAPLVNPETMMSILKTESSFNPYAINVNYGEDQLKKQPRTYSQAIKTAKRLILQRKSIDMGLAQINNKNLPRLGVKVKDIFKPCTNLNASQRILIANWQRTRKLKTPAMRLKATLSAYNTGNFVKGVKNGYVGKIIKSGSHVIPSINILISSLTLKKPVSSAFHQNNRVSLTATNKIQKHAFLSPKIAKSVFVFERETKKTIFKELKK